MSSHYTWLCRCIIASKNCFLFSCKHSEGISYNLFLPKKVFVISLIFAISARFFFLSKKNSICIYTIFFIPIVYVVNWISLNCSQVQLQFCSYCLIPSFGSKCRESRKLQMPWRIINQNLIAHTATVPSLLLLTLGVKKMFDSWLFLG